MTGLLFERCWLLFSIFLVAWLILLHGHVQKKGKRWTQAMLISPVPFIVLLVINLVVVTDHEALRKRVDTLTAAIQAGDIDALGEHLDKNFRSGLLTKPLTTKAAELALSRVKIGRVGMANISIKPPRVVLESWSQILGKDSNEDYGMTQSAWELEFIKRDGVWYILKATPLKVNNQNVGNLADVIRMSNMVH